MLLRIVDRVFSHETSCGILLMLSALAALVVANTTLAPLYGSLMALFFFLIGLKLKRDMIECMTFADLLLPCDLALLRALYWANSRSFSA